MANGVVQDPYTNYSFLIELDNIVRASFRQVSGLESTIDVIENPEGGRSVITKMAGRTKYANIVLRWGIDADRELYEWHRQISLDPSSLPAQRRGGAILLMNTRGETVARWDFERAWPCKYTAGDFNAETEAIAVETVELAHEGVHRVL